MLSFDEAQAQLANLAIRKRTETIRLDQALGRVLAQQVLAASDQPPFDRATMDGYAVVLAPGVTTYRVLATVLAGAAFEAKIMPGEAVRIMTGAPCPEGATVVPIERTNGGLSEVSIDSEALVPAKNIVWRGLEAVRGQKILASGLRLAPQTLSAAAMAGAERLECFQNPTLAIVTTGDEIGAGGPAGVRNSNGPYLVGFCQALGLQPTSLHAKDDPLELQQTLQQAAQDHDLVVTVGGVSMGSADLVPPTAESLGFRKVFHRVDIQPGKPVFLAQNKDGRLLLGLPGNPVSVLVTAHLFLAPLLGRFLGDWRPRWQERSLSRDFAHSGMRRLFLPATIDGAGVAPVAWSGSGDFYSAARGDGLVDLKPGGVWKRGDSLPFLPFLGHFPGETSVPAPL